MNCFSDCFFVNLHDNLSKRVWLSKAFYEDITLVAKVEGLSFKKASDYVFELGFKEFMVEVIRQQVAALILIPLELATSSAPACVFSLR